MEQENWVREAIAAQEEHIKRVTSCLGVVGQRHAFRPHGDPSRPAVAISRCVACGVTETGDDFERAKRE